MPLPFVDRFAPSPTAELHLGNLRTAFAGWLLTRAAGGRWLLRIEDLDRARVAAADGVAERQLADLQQLGLEWDGPIVKQSDRIDRYREVLLQLPIYECFCTRREIMQAASAPHDGFRAYPGTCRQLTSQQRSELRLRRRPAIRVDAAQAQFAVEDQFMGMVSGIVDDFVLMRGDGQFAYNFAAVVDDAAAGVTHITRGADLLSSAPRQAWLMKSLGAQPPSYAHIGLVRNDKGERLAKRDGAVTLRDLDLPTGQIIELLSKSLGLGPCQNVAEALSAMPGDQRFQAEVTWASGEFTQD